MEVLNKEGEKVGEDVSENENDVEEIVTGLRQLSADEAERLKQQASRPLAPNLTQRFEKESAKHWDKFYMRHGGNFFRERHWAAKELSEMVSLPREACLLEAGCGAGALLAALVAAGAKCNLFGCDLSPRAVDLLKSKAMLQGRVKAFRADIVSGDGLEEIPANSMDVITCVFLLSALSPPRQKLAIDNLHKCLRPSGVLYFRDYARYDMTQLRFKPGRLAYENFYIRHDGTGSYFFKLEELKSMFLESKYEIETIEYIERKTINIKENIDVPRYFLQAKFIKPSIGLIKETQL